MGDKVKVKSSGTLRMMTYMAPDIPMALFELMRDYLEEAIGVKIYLMTESRSTGPLTDRVDPLTSDNADLVFMSSTAYLELKEKENKFMELCKAAPLHTNARANDEPVCFSDVVVLTSKVQQQVYKDFEGLRGSRWAFSVKNSATGSTAMLQELKKCGYNANFFSSCFESGSHLNSLRMLTSGQVDVATVNSVVLSAFKADNPQLGQELTVIKSLGPLPVYTLLFNTRLPADLREKLTHAFLNLTTNGKFAGQFMTKGVKGFVPVTEENFQLENEIVDAVKEMSVAPAYY